MQRLIQRLVRLSILVPWLTVCIAVALAGLALWGTATSLTFETSRHTLTSSSAHYVQVEDALDMEFDRISYLIIVIEPPHPALGKQFVEALAARLRRDTRHVRDVIDKIDTRSLEGKKLLYLSAAELGRLHQRLDEAQDVLLNLADNPGLEQLLSSINQKIATAMVGALTFGLLESSAAETVTGSSLDVSFLSALFTELGRAVAAPTSYLFRSPWERFFLDESDVFSDEGYLTSNNDRFFFVQVEAASEAGGFVEYAAALRAIRSHLQALRQDFPQVRVGVTGEEALNTDEMITAQHDTMVASAISLIGVVALFIVAFGQVWRPLLMVGTLLVAICWTLGFTTLAVGHLNILTVAFVPILIGLGIDFAIHLVARYSEVRVTQADFETAILTAYAQTGPGIVAAASTTAVAFYAVILTNFRGLAELGLVSGSGLLLCLLASLTLLPALLALRERHRQVPNGIWQPRTTQPRHAAWPFPRTLLGTVILVTLAATITLPMPQFDYNLLNLQAQNTESVVWEHRLLDASDHSSLHVVATADSLPDLHRKTAQFNALPVVQRVESVASVMPENQTVRLPLVKALAPYVADIEIDTTELPAINLAAIRKLLQKIRFKLQRGANEWAADQRPSEAGLTAARSALSDLQRRLDSTPPEVATHALRTFQQALMQDFASKLLLLQRNVDPTPITLADVPKYLRQHFISKRGRYLLQIFARDSMWEREAMRNFVTQVQTIDPNITGGPVIAYYSIQQIQRGYARGGGYALLAIVCITALLFRQPKATLLALIPLLFGGLWTIAGMALLGVQLNLANLIIVPLFLGIAVDDGIHLVHRWQEEPVAALAPLGRSTGKAIVLTSLTSMMGFGSLMVAQHAGVFSLGLLTTLSVGCGLVATLVVLPLLSQLLAARPPSRP